MLIFHFSSHRHKFTLVQIDQQLVSFTTTLLTLNQVSIAHRSFKYSSFRSRSLVMSPTLTPDYL